MLNDQGNYIIDHVFEFLWEPCSVDQMGHILVEDSKNNKVKVRYV